jgi:pimeloyl-ACP methyl ester carboxylesterase
MKRLTLSCIVLAGSLLAAAGARAAAATEKYTFVIVHGATGGGWEWKQTGEFLSDDGHTVYRVTLTGLGERMHLNSTGIDLQTHIDDVVNTILFEDLHDVVLTGHSYGGMVITGVMDRMPERIRHVVFLDAAVPENGESIADHLGLTNQQNDPRIADGFMPVPWVQPDAKPPHAVKQSVKCFSQPVSYTNPAARALHVTFIGFMAEGRLLEERARTDVSWRNAAARGWTMRTFTGGQHSDMEDE